MTVAFYLEMWDRTYQEGIERGLSEKRANIFADNFVEHRAQQMMADMNHAQTLRNEGRLQ